MAAVGGLCTLRNDRFVQFVAEIAGVDAISRLHTIAQHFSPEHRVMPCPLQHLPTEVLA